MRYIAVHGFYGVGEEGVSPCRMIGSFTSFSNFRKIPLLLPATCLQNCAALMLFVRYSRYSRAMQSNAERICLGPPRRRVLLHELSLDRTGKERIFRQRKGPLNRRTSSARLPESARQLCLSLIDVTSYSALELRHESFGFLRRVLLPGEVLLHPEATRQAAQFEPLQ